MADYVLAQEDLDSADLRNHAFVDYTSLHQMFDPAISMPYDFNAISSPHDQYNMTMTSDAFYLNPQIQDTAMPGLLHRQPSSMGSSDTSSQIATPLNNGSMAVATKDQPWPGFDIRELAKRSAPHFPDEYVFHPQDTGDFVPIFREETAFGLAKIPDCFIHTDQWQLTSFAQLTDPSLIQQLPSPDQINLPQLPSNHRIHSQPQSQTSSQKPSLSPVESLASPIAWQEVLVPSQTQRHDAPTVKQHNQAHHTHSRKQSLHSLPSSGSPQSHSPPSYNVTDEDGKERICCPYPECGKSFKDLKAHMLTHQNERPEKCPITSCEFHKKGFARKYDRNRHLVTTHYKATITCGFCPGEDTSAAKTFNRTDIFKRHLVSAHAVDQNSSSSKKRINRGVTKASTAKSEGTSGKCSTCSGLFSNAQELFDHLDDCIMAVVTQTDPSETNNENNLKMVENDDDVLATMRRHSLPSHIYTSAGDQRDSSSAELNDGGRPKTRKTNSGASLALPEDSQAQATDRARHGLAGLTFSKGGHELAVAKGRRKRKDYPQSWGCAIDDMTLKKRVLCVFDGQRRLWKDDMMLGNQFEVRMQLPDGGFVTDLDVETLKRAEAFHNATEEERGEWMPTNFYSGELPAAEDGSYDNSPTALN